MAKRRGMGKDQGMGFKNILNPQDQMTHSNNAQGISQNVPIQPFNDTQQKVSISPTTTGSPSFTERTESFIEDLIPIIKRDVDIGKKKTTMFIEEKAKPAVQRGVAKTKQFVEEKATPFVKSSAERAKLRTQEFFETKVKPTVTPTQPEVPLNELSNDQLKRLAITQKPQLFFGNMYENELVRRAKKDEQLTVKVQQVRIKERQKATQPQKSIIDQLLG